VQNNMRSTDSPILTAPSSDGGSERMKFRLACGSTRKMTVVALAAFLTCSASAISQTGDSAASRSADANRPSTPNGSLSANELKSELADWDKEKSTHRAGSPATTSPVGQHNPVAPKSTSQGKRAVKVSDGDIRASDLESELMEWDRQQVAARELAQQRAIQQQIAEQKARAQQATRDLETARQQSSQNAIAAREQAVQDEQNRQQAQINECIQRCGREHNQCEADNTATAAGNATQVLGASIIALKSHSAPQYSPPPQLKNCGSVDECSDRCSH
jgi:hypothetical protein